MKEYKYTTNIPTKYLCPGTYLPGRDIRILLRQCRPRILGIEIGIHDRQIIFEILVRNNEDECVLSEMPEFKTLGPKWFEFKQMSITKK